MPQTENVENSLIFYRGFKTVLTDQVREKLEKLLENSRKTSKTQEWLVVESCPTPR